MTHVHLSKSLVLYHSACADGFTAAWAAWKTLGDEGGTYRPVQYDRGLPTDLLIGEEGETFCYKNIYVLDFSFSAKELRELKGHLHSGGKVILLDHHKTAVEKLQPLIDEPDEDIVLVFDMDKSGARLAWEHFHPGTTPPQLVRYVEDRDLWRHEMHRCHEVRAYAETVPFDFEEWTKFAADLEENAEDVADDGEMMLRYRDTKVKLRAARPGFVNLLGHILPCVNDTNYGSEVGNLLAQEYPAAVIFFVTNWGKVIYSLRSAKENPNHLDVSEIAKTLGGGGHKHAAGFRSNALPMFVEPCPHDKADDNGHCTSCGALNVKLDDTAQPDDE